MNVAVAEAPRVVHALPGRVRVHLPDWEGQGQRGLEGCLRRMRGVSDVRSSPLTRNVLVHFDPENPYSGSSSSTVTTTLSYPFTGGLSNPISFL